MDETKMRTTEMQELNVNRFSKIQEDPQKYLAEALTKITQYSEGILEKLKIIESKLDDEDIGDDASDDLDACEDVPELIIFMEDWLEREEIQEVIRFLNNNYKYHLATTGSEERLLERLSDDDKIDFHHLKEAIQETSGII